MIKKKVFLKYKKQIWEANPFQFKLLLCPLFLLWVTSVKLFLSKVPEVSPTLITLKILLENIFVLLIFFNCSNFKDQEKREEPEMKMTCFLKYKNN